MKAKVHTLTTENDFRLIGVVSHLSPHKISWMFNQELNVKFQQSDSLIANKTEGDDSPKFSVYKYEDVGDVLYTLFSNKAEQSTLIKSIKKLDYIIKCEGHISENNFQNLLDKVKKLKNILTAFEITYTDLKNKEKELFT